MSIKKFLLGLPGLILAYFIFYPAPIDPVAVDFPRMQVADNARLGEITVLRPDRCHGCEDISFDQEGNIYTGDERGGLWRFKLADPNQEEKVVQFKGRPLGLEVLGDTLAWVAVEAEGLAAVDLINKTYDIKVNSYNDTIFKLIDYLDVGKSGAVYFTDASDKYSDEDLQYDVMEGKPNGALYRYQPATGQTTRLVDDLYFANGVVVDTAEQYVLVAETGAFRIKRHWLAGPQAGQTEIFAEGFPGWPDGISRGTDGLIYTTLISPRTALHDFILPRVWPRKLVTKLPQSWWPEPVAGNRIFAFDDNGTLVHDWMNPTPAFSGISSVERRGNQLYFGTLNDKGIGVIDVPE
ncbi:MAG: SMP-30/gluconolactonase/LRE family protein [Bacteroidota bacterium]